MSEVTETKYVHTERVFVGAEMARRWMRNNVSNNRPLQNVRVQEYMRDMKSGRWRENGSTIVFADTGELIDGQHRLQACMEGGVGFWTLIAYGVHKEAFLTIDRGQSRSTGQMLHLSTGVSDYNAVSATLTLLYRFRDGIVIASGRPTSVEAEELLLKNPGISDSIRAARRVLAQFRVGPIPVTAISHYLFTRQDATLAEAFFDALATGASLREIDPVYQLRFRIIGASSSTSKRIGSYELLALMFKAWIAEREQRTFKMVLRWSQSESFPNIGPIDSIHKVRIEKAVTPSSHAGKQMPKRIKPIPKDPKPESKLDQLLARHKGLDHQNN